MVRGDKTSDHPHLGEVHQALLGEVGGPLLDESQVGEVHAQVGDARRVAAAQTHTTTSVGF